MFRGSSTVCTTSVMLILRFSSTRLPIPFHPIPFFCAGLVATGIGNTCFDQKQHSKRLILRNRQNRHACTKKEQRWRRFQTSVSTYFKIKNNELEKKETQSRKRRKPSQQEADIRWIITTPYVSTLLEMICHRVVILYTLSRTNVTWRDLCLRICPHFESYFYLFISSFIAEINQGV